MFEGTFSLVAAHFSTIVPIIILSSSVFNNKVSIKWCMLNIFGSIVYNQAIEYKWQNFLKAVVHMITIDKFYQTALDEIQATVIYRRAIRVAVTSECF